MEFSDFSGSFQLFIKVKLALDAIYMQNPFLNLEWYVK